MSDNKFPVIGAGGSIEGDERVTDGEDGHIENSTDVTAMATEYSRDQNGVETVETASIPSQLPTLARRSTELATQQIVAAEKRNSVKTPP